MPAAAAHEISASEGWHARLDLELSRAGGRTVVTRRAHRGPLQIQRPFYPEGPAVAHVYVLHPPGGLVAGDALHTDVRVRGEARALLTTPAATKIYRSRAPSLVARPSSVLRVETGAALEWLPGETILFDGARAELSTEVHLEGDALFIGWEILCLGRPSIGERFAHGLVRQRWELLRNGVPLATDRLTLPGSGTLLDAAFGLRGAPVVGTLLASPLAYEALDDLRALAAFLPASDLASVTTLDGVIVGRYLGASVERARRWFGRLWAALRPALLGRAAMSPRIWAT